MPNGGGSDELPDLMHEVVKRLSENPLETKYCMFFISFLLILVLSINYTKSARISPWSAFVIPILF